MATKDWPLIGMLSICLIGGALDILFYVFAIDAEPVTVSLSGVGWVICLVLWMDADAKNQPRVVRPFDHGFLLLLFWAPYLPYYLWRTRRVEGVIMLFGFLLLPLLGWLGKIVVYVWLSGISG